MTMTSAAKYRQQIKDAQAEIVDVIAPSGFCFQFEKPSKFGMLFGMGNMPTSAASKAVESWQKDGVLEVAADGKQDTMQLFEMALRIKDRVLRLSYSPKIVIGKADESKDELSADDIAPVDLEYLFNWVSAGGEASAMLGNFPRGSQPSVVAKPNRKARRAASK